MKKILPLVCFLYVFSPLAFSEFPKWNKGDEAYVNDRDYGGDEEDDEDEDEDEDDDGLEEILEEEELIFQRYPAIGEFINILYAHNAWLGEHIYNALVGDVDLLNAVAPLFQTQWSVPVVVNQIMQIKNTKP